MFSNWNWKKSTLTVLFLSSAYILACVLYHEEFRLLSFTAILNISFLPLLFNKMFIKQHSDDPVKFITFTESSLKLGRFEYKKKEVKKVHLDLVEDKVHFILPYNKPRPIAGPDVASFTFPIDKLKDLMRYLEENLPSVEVILWPNNIINGSS